MAHEFFTWEGLLWSNVYAMKVSKVISDLVNVYCRLRDRQHAVYSKERYAGKKIFIGSVTGLYRPCEEKYKRTRAVLEQLQGSRAKLYTAIKSDLILTKSKFFG